MSVIGIIARIVGAVIAQPGVQDFVSRAAQRAIKQATRQMVHAIHSRTSTRKTTQTMR